MKLRLSEIHQATQLDVTVPAMSLELGFQFTAAVEGTQMALEVTPVGEGHRLSGRFSYRATVPCSRCLKEVALSAEVQFLQEYRPMPAVAPWGKEVEVTPNNEFLVYYEEDALLTEDLVRQQLYLDLPGKPLCVEDCKGLCPRCGADLNEGPCTCPEAVGEPA